MPLLGACLPSQPASGAAYDRGVLLIRFQIDCVAHQHRFHIVNFISDARVGFRCLAKAQALGEGPHAPAQLRGRCWIDFRSMLRRFRIDCMNSIGNPREIDLDEQRNRSEIDSENFEPMLRRKN